MTEEVEELRNRFLQY